MAPCSYCKLNRSKTYRSSTTYY
ncbi:hypothetical protein CCACVL1_30027 [Corchorus capsularis]|uniref:Uncharacterized protein n=1 Tax=Corchorus capsularis TaxID=210143 RepID=A0A1R3FZ17_COCAP|nr:hypothetical protein CCACVL1_30027 [Corchorus capsularis]